MFVVDYLSTEGYLVTTDLRYRRRSEKGDRRISTDLDILALKRNRKPLIGEVYASTLDSKKKSDQEVLSRLINKLNEGIISYKSQKIGLGTLLEELGIGESIDRCLFVWCIKTDEKDVKKKALSRGVKIITFSDMFKKLIMWTWKRIKEERWFEQRNYTQAILAMLLLLHKEGELDLTEIVRNLR
jgi:hypothetical protein